MNVEESKNESKVAIGPGPIKIPRDVLVQHALSTEYAQVARNPVDGIFVAPSDKDSFKWFGIVFIRNGIFGGGIFRFTIYIPSDFPETTQLPDVIFANSIFHPLIDFKSRKLDLTRSFPSGWKKQKHNLLRVLIVIQRIFFSYQFDCDNCINPEAAILYKEHKEKFKEMAKGVVETSRSQVYDDPEENDINAIRLSPWDTSIHDRVRKEMLLIGNDEQDQISNEKIKKLTNSTAADYRRELFAKECNFSQDEVVGRHFPRSYSWLDTESKTILNRPPSRESLTTDDSVNNARKDREKHGIEPLDLSTISCSNSVDNSPKSSQNTKGNTGSEESVI